MHGVSEEVLDRDLDVAVLLERVSDRFQPAGRRAVLEFLVVGPGDGRARASHVGEVREIQHLVDLRCAAGRVGHGAARRRTTAVL